MWTYQDTVKGGRCPSSLHVAQDCHSCVETQAFDNKLEGWNAQMWAEIKLQAALYLVTPVMTVFNLPPNCCFKNASIPKSTANTTVYNKTCATHVQNTDTEHSKQAEEKGKQQSTSKPF